MSAFVDLVKNLKGRNFGGTSYAQVAEPYISGYHYTYWSLPATLKSGITDYMGAGNPSEPQIGSDDIAEVLSGTCLAVTPPGGTINKTEIQGIGNTKWNVPTGIDYGTELSCKFLEYTGLPVFSIISGWCKWIRDNKTGLTPMFGDEYIKSNYAASVFYWTTKPDGHTVEYAACYSGVFPTKDPQDLFTGDVAAIDKLEMDLQFSLDFIWHEDWVYAECQKHATEYSNRGNSSHSDFVNSRGSSRKYSEPNLA